MSNYIPTEDEVETAFMSFVSDLEHKFPGSYEEAPEFASMHESAKGFQRWKKQVQADAWDEGKEYAMRGLDIHGDTNAENPYREAFND